MTDYTVLLIMEQKLRQNTEAVCEKLSEPHSSPRTALPAAAALDRLSLDAVGRTSAGNHHGNRKAVNLREQLTELSKDQVMPGIRPKIKMS